MLSSQGEPRTERSEQVTIFLVERLGGGPGGGWVGESARWKTRRRRLNGPGSSADGVGFDPNKSQGKTRTRRLGGPGRVAYGGSRF